MLDANKPEELTKIVEKANEFLHERGIQDFSIIGINWRDDDDQWAVSYYSDYGIEYTYVFVEKSKNGYRQVGHSFESSLD